VANTTGRFLRVTTWGESHGPAIGAVVDGCPSGLPLAPADVQWQLDRRRPGQSSLTTRRDEADAVLIDSGVFEGRTLGTPIALRIQNTDTRPKHYEKLRDLYRPSHADYTWAAKFGHRDWRGGGRASARETASRVAAGALAQHLLRRAAGVEVVAFVDQVGDVTAGPVDLATVCVDDVDRHAVRCPDAAAAARMEDLIREVRAGGDTVGGAIRCVARGLPPGLGEPVFGKLTADLAHALMTLPATRGVEFGLGFGAIAHRGSTHNDAFWFDPATARVRTRTNRSGGIQGGITNGEDVVLRVAFKPVATIFKDQETVDVHGRAVTFRAEGRHDPCVVPRAVPIVETAVALVLADHWLLHRARAGLFPGAP
jgi:chorismate synthase